MLCIKYKKRSTHPSHVTAKEEPSDGIMKKGAGVFTLNLNPVISNKNIGVDYYMPKGFNKNMMMPIVIPGAGSHANDYRYTFT